MAATNATFIFFSSQPESRGGSGGMIPVVFYGDCSQTLSRQCHGIVTIWSRRDKVLIVIQMRKSSGIFGSCLQHVGAYGVKLPNGDKANVPLAKLEGYVLNADHPDGQHKARVFRSVLGITIENAGVLRTKLLEVAHESEAKIRPATVHGQGYEIRFRMTGPNGNTAEVVSGWIIDTGAEIPRLTTCLIDL